MFCFPYRHLQFASQGPIIPASMIEGISGPASASGPASTSASTSTQQPREGEREGERGRERQKEAERARESQQPQPHPLPIIDVEQPLLNMSLCNIDGLVLVGRMPTFCQVDPGSINLNHLRVCLMDINTLPDKKFHSAKLVQFTYSCGIPVMVATDLDLASLCRNILQYLAKAQPGEAGMENNWIVVSNDSIEAIEMALIFNGKDKLRIDQKFWDTFSAYVETIMHASEDLYSHTWI
jgi:hypothetical protein